MLFIDIRNTIVERLEEYLRAPGVLSDQVQPVVNQWPFWYYSVLTSYTPTGEGGNYTHTPTGDGKTVKTVRVEQPYASLSFTFCSMNRWKLNDQGQPTETYIYG